MGNETSLGLENEERRLTKFQLDGAFYTIGVIDKEGNVVIPFENKMIKAIAPNLLLVERANSTTPSVVEAIKLRSDPLAATKLVTTPATIKDQIN